MKQVSWASLADHHCRPLVEALHAGPTDRHAANASREDPHYLGLRAAMHPKPKGFEPRRAACNCGSTPEA